jgi:hypothetical protein
LREEKKKKTATTMKESTMPWNTVGSSALYLIAGAGRGVRFEHEYGG